MADYDDELAAAVRELTRTIDDLRAELESSHGRPRLGPPALRPPTPRELLRFADEIAIPAAITVLETSVRALEGFQRAIELTRTEQEVRDRTTEAADTAGERASALRRTTLSQLDTVLAQLQRATTAESDTSNEQLDELLAQARALRDDVDSRLRDVDDDLERPESSTDAIRIDIEDGGIDEVGDADSPADAERDEPASRVDVDAELETLKDQYGSEEADSGDANPAEQDEHAAGESDADDGNDDSTGSDENGRSDSDLSHSDDSDTDADGADADSDS
ncbi:DUF7547 family protein [Natronorubrum sp. FCH18a]|uniref:DUF7547 family protein n=1 Tax=Natronorubrum sp. FCH18a TaxID=3447018 RepID=UPI003F50DFDF